MDEQDETQRFAALIVETAALSALCAAELARSGCMSAEAGPPAIASMKRIAGLLEPDEEVPTGAAVLVNSLAEQVRRYTAGNPPTSQG